MSLCYRLSLGVSCQAQLQNCGLEILLHVFVNVLHLSDFLKWDLFPMALKIALSPFSNSWVLKKEHSLNCNVMFKSVMATWLSTGQYLA